MQLCVSSAVSSNLKNKIENKNKVVVDIIKLYLVNHINFAIGLVINSYEMFNDVLQLFIFTLLTMDYDSGLEVLNG